MDDQSPNLISALDERQTVIRDFILLYKKLSVLWNKTHPNYRDKEERSKASKLLLEKYREYYPDADEHIVKMKIDSLRSSFRREYKKVIANKNSTNDENYKYKPSLWYYDLMLFTIGVEDSECEKNYSTDTTTQYNKKSSKLAYWNWDHTAILIHLLRKFPILYNQSHPNYKNKTDRLKAYENITNNLIEATGKGFVIDEVKKKIDSLKTQYNNENRKLKKYEIEGKTFKTGLWCYKMLTFLDNPINNTINDSSDNQLTQQLDEDKEMNDYDSSSSDCDQRDSNYSDQVKDDDIYDTIAKMIAYKFRFMQSEQRKLAERIIMDVMYHGQMEGLTENSRLSLDGN